MSLFDVGRMVVKIAGRDAGRKAVVVDVLDSTFVLIDGETRRRKVNICHLEPLAEVLPLSPGASHKEVKDVLEKAGVEVRDAKSKQTSPRPPRLRKGKKTAMNAAEVTLVEQNVEKKPKKTRKEA